MAAIEREAHILGMIDQLTGEIGAYLAQFADEDQSERLPFAMMRLRDRMRQVWTGFVDREAAHSPVWKMLP